jgi:hypothetical protein
MMAAVAALFMFVMLFNSFKVHSAGNEWMLVIRSGQLKTAGVGISAWKLPSDQVVRFPSHI